MSDKFVTEYLPIDINLFLNLKRVLYLYYLTANSKFKFVLNLYLAYRVKNIYRYQVSYIGNLRSHLYLVFT